MRKIALALIAASAVAAVATTPANANNMGPVFGRMMQQAFARTMPRQGQVQQRQGVAVCPMYATTDGGQYGQDCARSWANYHMQVQMWDNSNTPGALAARGIVVRGGAVAAPIGVPGGQMIQQPSQGIPIPVTTMQYRCVGRDANGNVVSVTPGACPQ